MVFSLIIILTDSVSSLRINEIESNPQGEDSGNEWIEIYSETEVNLEGYYLENGDGGVVNLTGSFSGYFAITFSGRWLDNDNETVYLKIGENIIDEYGAFDDSKNDELAYSFCDGTWKFISSTKNAQNSCENVNSGQPNVNNIQEIEEENDEPKIEKKETLNNSLVEQSSEITETKSSKISLIREDKPVQEITKTYKTRIGVIYFFIGFCIFIVVLMSLRKL